MGPTGLDPALRQTLDALAERLAQRWPPCGFVWPALEGAAPGE